MEQIATTAISTLFQTASKLMTVTGNPENTLPVNRTFFTELMNTTSMNSTSNEHKYDEPKLSTVAKGLIYAAFVFIFVVGSIGNLTVLYVIGFKHRLARSCDVHIVSLAIADTLSAIFVPLVQIHDLITDLSSWHILGNFGCKLLQPLNELTLLVSALMLVTISISRLRYYLLIDFNFLASFINLLYYIFYCILVFYTLPLWLVRLINGIWKFQLKQKHIITKVGGFYFKTNLSERWT